LAAVSLSGSVLRVEWVLVLESEIPVLALELATLV
jgi:hypothetical protein